MLASSPVSSKKGNGTRWVIDIKPHTRMSASSNISPTQMLFTAKMLLTQPCVATGGVEMIWKVVIEDLK